MRSLLLSPKYHHHFNLVKQRSYQGKLFANDRGLRGRPCWVIYLLRVTRLWYYSMAIDDCGI